MIGNACPAGSRLAELASWLSTSGLVSVRARLASAAGSSGAKFPWSPSRRTVHRRICSFVCRSPFVTSSRSSFPRKFKTQKASSAAGSPRSTISLRKESIRSGRSTSSRRATSRYQRFGWERNLINSAVDDFRTSVMAGRTKFFGVMR